MSLTSNPKLNTIHEPHLQDVIRMRTRSMQVTSAIPIDAINDHEVEHYNNRGPYDSFNDQTYVRYGQTGSPTSPASLYNR